MVQSEAFSTSDWIRNNTNVTANATISPEGVQNASEIEFTNTGAEIYDQFINVASSMHIGTIFLKNKDVDTLVFEVIGGSPSIQAKVTVDLVNGTLSDAIGDFTPTIEDFGNGWYRVAIGDTGTATIATPSFKLESVGGNTGSFYAYGAMVEVGSYSTSYVPSYGTSTTRVEDSCSKTGISSLLNPSEGALFLEINTPDNQTLSKVFTIGDGTTNRIQTFYYEDSIRLNFIAGGTTHAYFNHALTDVNDTIKVAISYATNDIRMYVNGVLTNSDTSATMPSSLSYARFDNGSGGAKFIGNIKQSLVFTTALTNDQLEELTK
jgi:hypothetical protein